MARVSITQLRNTFQRFLTACRKVGIRTPLWELHEGSQPNGISYRLFKQYKGSTGHHHCPFPDYLGDTCREADTTLENYITALEVVERLNFR